jgi:4-hydroxy-tetrahydrodipicolinate reductase
MFGSGINPGFANLFALVSTQVCDRIDQIRVIESVDSTDYDSGDTELSVGYTLPIDTPGLLAKTEQATLVFSDAVAMMADALGVELDEITFDADYAAATEAEDLGYMTIPEGGVAAIDGRWRGRFGGRDLIVLNFQWMKGRHVTPPFKLRHGYHVEIEGEPNVHSQLMIFPGKDWSEPGYMGLGMIMTAMPAVNAIPAVVAAPPGIATHATLGLVTAGAFVSGR